jgi:acyl carrier protein
MSMRETEVGCFIRFYDKKFRELNLLNFDGTGFNVIMSPAYPFMKPTGTIESSGYQIPGNQITKITPPEITFHTLKRILPNYKYQNNFIADIYGEEGSADEGIFIGKKYSQEVDMSIQATIWAEDPRQREFLKIEFEKSFINHKYMRKILFEIGIRHGWEDGFIVQNLYLNHSGDIDYGSDNSEIMPDTISSDNEFWPRLYIATYEINFTTEIRDTEWFYKNTIFDIKELKDTGMDLSSYDIYSKDSMIDIIIDLSKYYGIIINKIDENNQIKTVNDIIREAAIKYGNLKNIYVDSYSYMESLEAITIGPIASY